MMQELQLFILDEKTVEEALADLQAVADNDFEIMPGLESRYEAFLK
jgi:glycerol-3-phosphate responsive antiterminator